MTVKVFLWWDKIKPFLFVPLIVLSSAWIFLHCDREDLDFALADLQDTIPAYSNYLTGYPNPRHKFAVEKRLEELYFLKARRIGTVESYNMFLQMNPSEHLAEKARFERDNLVPLRKYLPDTIRSSSNWYFEVLLKRGFYSGSIKKGFFNKMGR